LTENPRLIHKVLLCDTEVGVWHTPNATKIIQPNFFPDTVNSEDYTGQTLTSFFKMKAARRRNRWFSSKTVQHPIQTVIQWLPYITSEPE
jgi:hypothetical protein